MRTGAVIGERVMSWSDSRRIFSRDELESVAFDAIPTQAGTIRPFPAFFARPDFEPSVLDGRVCGGAEAKSSNFHSFSPVFSNGTIRPPGRDRKALPSPGALDFPSLEEWNPSPCARRT
jgi:hypothetical protein